MPTVLLRLSAPLQAYGTTSQWEERATAVRPTKSAAVGLIANALGYEFDDDLTDLRHLEFAVRADRPGHLMTDQQSAGGGHFPATAFTPAEPGTAVPGKWYGAARSPIADAEGTLRASWKPGDRTTVLINKQYVADAAFLAGLSTPHQDLADQITAALERPYRPLYLGRRSCPPGQPIAHGITPHGPTSWPDLVPLLPEATTTRPRAWVETAPGEGTMASPEQVPTTFAARDHALLHLRAFDTHPPAATSENTP